MAVLSTECAVENCARSVRMNAIFCSLHYQRWRKYGDPLEGPIPGAIGVRLPFVHLWARAGCRTQGELAERVGTTRRTVERWKRDGVPVISADRAAGAVGFHPWEVWGVDWDVCSTPSHSGSKVSP